ncbi:3'-5' exonuclease [Sphingomonas sp. CFBP 13720]|uniref:3'-5' exonuclease n=1 Tax=Sphingomonas sp. CFBP 13720 TaxID=2775302 RepID=UPI00177B8C18|nr:3'-5' exonuclease [Sphingomonas sp. CFBP 13720]MBD8677953.1 3'-5' exoribonuclease [Sphingomonas sp. CFBP 13720]
MIDLETMGTTPGCTIVAIGAVRFSIDGFINDRFYHVVSRDSCLDAGLFECAQTAQWWTNQSAQAQSVLTDYRNSQQSEPLRAVLIALNTFIRAAGGRVEIYGNGSDFDNAILATAARAVDLDLAWSFWENRCYRTIKARSPGVNIYRQGTHHNALDDAISQAEHLGRIERATAFDSDKLAHGLLFLNWMADRYRERTCRRFLGLRLPTMTRAEALNHARATFDAIPLDEPFGSPDMDWDEEGAATLVDLDLEHWDQ